MSALHTRLLPELEAELATTRRILAALPEGNLDFKCHEKSMALTSLAGHTAEMPAFIHLILTTPSMDLSLPSPTPPFKHQTTAATLAAYDSFAASLLSTFATLTDEAFDQPWSLVHGEYKIFSGPRYDAYRTMGLNHLIHHRAQLGVYLRLMNIPLPKTYGPSADEM